MATDKSHRGNASQFYVAGELCRRGYAALVTVGNTPNTDILCSNIEGTRFVHIQVKTFVPGDPTCAVGRKAELNPGASFFWILAGIPEANSDRAFEYFVIPAVEMARNVSRVHADWLATPGRNGAIRNDSSFRRVGVSAKTQVHTWSVESFREKWSLIESVLT